MGFGLLFLGYFLTLPMTIYMFYTLPFGAALIIWACFKLSRVNRPFIRSFYTACAVVPFAIAACVLRLVPATVWLAPYFEAVTLVIWMLLHVFLLTGVEWVAQETNLPKLRTKAFRNKIFSLIFLLPATGLTIIEVFTITGMAKSFVHGFSIAIIFVGLVVMLLNLLTFYSAYMHICMPEDLSMPQKPSRFEFVNRRRAEEDKREAENSAALDAARARKQAEREARRNQKKATVSDQQNKNQKK